jgi:hypothetical protein
MTIEEMFNEMKKSRGSMTAKVVVMITSVERFEIEDIFYEETDNTFVFIMKDEDEKSGFRAQVVSPDGLVWNERRSR